MFSIAPALLAPLPPETRPTGAPLVAADAVLSVTTDTPAYCSALARRLQQVPNAPAEAQALEQAGHDMCARGEIRGGIRRLRQALALIHGQGAR